MAKIYEKASDQHVGVINLYFSSDDNHPSGNGRKGYYADTDLTIDPDMDEILGALSRGVPVRLVQLDGAQLKNVAFILGASVDIDGHYIISSMGATAGDPVDKHGKKVEALS